MDLCFSIVVRTVNQNIWEECLWSYSSVVEVMVEMEVHFQAFLQRISFS